MSVYVLAVLVPHEYGVGSFFLVEKGCVPHRLRSGAMAFRRADAERVLGSLDAEAERQRIADLPHNKFGARHR